jgi:hypothetical protein
MLNIAVRAKRGQQQLGCQAFGRRWPLTAGSRRIAMAGGSGAGDDTGEIDEELVAPVSADADVGKKKSGDYAFLLRTPQNRHRNS